MIYVDTNVIIRLIEGDGSARAPLEERLAPLKGTGCFLMTCQLSRLECRTKPMRDDDKSLLALYDDFFRSEEVDVLPLSIAVVDKATEIRAAYKVKTPDALHLAAAIIAGAKAFVTGDKSLARCTEITVETL